MKYFIIFIFTLSTFILLSTLNTFACSCADIDIDESVNRDNSYLFTGTIHEVISSKKVVVKVEQSFSQDPISEYVVLYTTTSFGASCGINFHDRENDKIFVHAYSDTSNTMLKTNLCSYRTVTDNTVSYISMNGVSYEELTLTEISQYLMNTGVETEAIEENSRNQVMLRAYTPTFLIYGVIILIVTVAGVIIYRKLRV